MSQQRSEDRQAQASAAALRPQEREIAERKTEELQDLVSSLIEDKADIDGSQQFTLVSTLDGDCAVLKPKAMDGLSDKMLNLINLGRFVTLPVNLVMDVQSLLEPTITSTTKMNLFAQEDESPEWVDSIEAAKLALKACKMVLDTMIEGRDDYRMRREEIVDMIVDLIKFTKDACIIPIVQARRSGPTTSLFTAASREKNELRAVLWLCGSVLGRFATLIGKCNLSDRALNSLEFLTLELVMEQNSETEKDSVFSVSKFEQFRQKTLDVLAQIFARHSEQRNSILNGILSNLEKVSDKKASARQFKSAREVPIMTISALFMRFVQVAATNPDTQTKAAAARSAAEPSDEEGSDYEPGKSAKKQKRRNDTPGQTAQTLFKNGTNIAYIIASSLVERASNVSKTGDKPFRNLLDLFIEDFCNVLGSPEWPAADMLLQQLIIRIQLVLQIDQSAKHSVVDKEMALATMSRIGCGVIDFKLRLRKLMHEQLDASQPGLSSKLARLLNDALNDDTKEGVDNMDLLAFHGPYRMVIESLRDYLDLHASQEDPHLQSTTGCHMTSWLASVIQAFPEEDTDAQPLAAREVRERLDSMIMDSKWLARKYKFQTVSDVQSKIAAGIITLQGKVCRHVPTIVQTMTVYMRDKHSSNLRSRGMSCLEQLVHKDSGVITEREVRNMIEVLFDTSPKVRESALNFVATCLALKPSLEQHFLKSIMKMTADASNGPKKRAIKLLKDVYNATDSEDSRPPIIANLLLPTQDDEKSVSELSCNVLEDIVLASARPTAKRDESQLKFERAKRSELIVSLIQLIHGSPRHLEAFEKFFIYALSVDAKAVDTNAYVCKDLVADMIDAVISPASGSDATAQSRTMTALSIFAKVKPALFTVDQIQLLKLYIKEIGTADDLYLLRPTVVIFRHVVASLPTLQQSFAEEVRASLMRNVSKLANWASHGRLMSRETLVDVAHCLWTVTPMVDQGPLKLFNMLASIVCQLRPLVLCTKEEAVQKQGRIQSYLILLGTFGKVCNFGQYDQTFRERLAAQANSFIAKKTATAEQLGSLCKPNEAASLLLLGTVRPFTMQTWDMSIREEALQSVGGICQSSPKLFTRAEIEKVFELVWENKEPASLQRVVLTAFNEYFAFAERRSDTGAAIAVGMGAETGSMRLETSFVASENDTAPLHLAKKFLDVFVETALAHNNELTVLALSIITSISRQGLIHPKEAASVLVALGTSSNERIASGAFIEHKRIHEKQESYLEKEYMHSIRIAFNYQKEVFADPHGMRETNYSAKLGNCFEVLKAGKKATFKKFIVNICKEVDFNPSKVDTNGAMPDAVLFARFCLENLALLDFPSFEELAICLNAVEAIVLKNTGPAVALSIETEMPKQWAAPDMLEQQLVDASGTEGTFESFMKPGPSTTQLVPPTIEDARLREITIACMILHMVWETRTFIRRCYNLHKLTGRIPQKEHVKPAQRNNFVSGKELLDRLMPIMDALNTRDTMIKTCYDFAELLEIDREAQIGEEGDENGLGAGYETPTEGDGPNGLSFPTSGRGRKRKSSANIGNTPKKPRGRPAKNKKRNSRTPDGDDDSD